jgi:hypothetical protein
MCLTLHRLCCRTPAGAACVRITSSGHHCAEILRAAGLTDVLDLSERQTGSRHVKSIIYQQ